jgi:G3E family GTPase
MRHATGSAHGRSDLGASVASVLARRDALDYLIVETSGAADPRPIACALQVARAVQQRRVARTMQSWHGTAA